MSLIKLANRVKETSITTGNGSSYTLQGPAAGFQSFVAGIGDGNKCTYCVSDDVNWEINEGTVTDAASDTLSRGTLIASSTGSAINWAEGTRDVFLMAPAERFPMVPIFDSGTIAAATASVNFSGLDATYRAIMFVGTGVITTANDAKLLARISISASFKSDGAYDNTFDDSAGGSIANTHQTTATSIPISGGNTSGGLHAIDFVAWLFRPSDTSFYKQVHFKAASLSSGGTRNVRDGYGYYASASAVDGIQFLPDSSTLAGGRIQGYGMRA